MTEKYRPQQSALKQYLAQRYYFGLIGSYAPVFLVLGNHDGETARELDGTAASTGVWANATRKNYFPMPITDKYYTGNSAKDKFASLLEDYYAWQWGDALFVVLDLFWHSPLTKGGEENWKRTLGSEQYGWLKRTMESSKAKYKFVFIHNLVGGLEKDARGGTEAASLYEWGGKDPDGTDSFKKNRPDWPAPIHKLLVDNHVSAVFHGHDHFFAKQELDGVIYQEVPQPGFDGRERPDVGAEYSYKSGEILGGSGYIRVKITADCAKVEYIKVPLNAGKDSAPTAQSAACSLAWFKF